jgi:hypothetical protein
MEELRPREALLSRKVEVQNKSRPRARIVAIRTSLMDEYIRRMQMRFTKQKMATGKSF